jgi:protocatechuate 3,4-dioxygenase beta subunit
MSDEPLSRRQVVRLGLAALPLSVALAACSDDGDNTSAPASPTTARSPATTGDGSASATTLEPTPSCDDGDDVTEAQTEGPYFTPGSPERTSLREAGVAGEALSLSGTVVDTECRPVSRALLDFWQADGDGEYDNVGFRLRGHQFSDADGRFRLATVVPGLYPGRTRHIHVKVQAPNSSVLTTQLYFPGEAGNDRDGIYSPALVVGVNGEEATFQFVVRT